MRKIFVTLFLIIFFAGALAHSQKANSQEALFLRAVEEAKSGDYRRAYNRLIRIDDQKFEAENLHMKYMALGAWAMELENLEKTREHLKKALELETNLPVYANYLIALSYKKEGDYDPAVEYYNKTLSLGPTRNIRNDSRYDLGLIEYKRERYPQAFSHLNYVERRWRNTFRHPEVIWHLIGVELKRGRKWQACRWARRMWSRHPGHSLAREWGVDLHMNSYEGETTGCVASPNEINSRVRHLQLAGQDEKARREIDLLISRVGDGERLDVDLLLAEFLDRQGYVDEAMQVLIRHYESQKEDHEYLNQFARAAAKAGEFPVAVGAYHRVFKLNPNSAAGRRALFSAAFLSYQFQDYDGANRKFQEFRRRYASSGLARDSRWHLAWIRYLRGDYAGAESELTGLSTYTRGRGRNRRLLTDDRARYWMAMSQFRQDKFAEAREVFASMAEDSSKGYYSVLARNRLVQIPQAQPERSLAQVNNIGERSLTPMTTLPVPQVESSSNGGLENESEDQLGSELSAGISGRDEEDDAAIEDEDDEKIQVTSFRDPRLQNRFDRAASLTELGQNEWARWELYEIERRTSNKVYLRNLMTAYNKIEAYHRSSYIAEIYFSTERTRGGLTESRDLWEYNYPIAYRDLIQKYTKQFNVHEGLALAIMRAESRFNRYAISPVGARGLMQIMPYTAERLASLLNERGYSDERLLEPELNVRMGVRYLSRLQRKFKDQIPLVAGGYNAGPHRVNSWLNSFGNMDMDEFIEHVPFVETRNYMKKVVRYYAIYRELYADDNLEFAWLTSPVPVRISSRPSPRENWETLD